MTDYDKFITFLENSNLWHDDTIQSTSGKKIVYFWTPGLDRQIEIGNDPSAKRAVFTPDGKFYDVQS